MTDDDCPVSPYRPLFHRTVPRTTLLVGGLLTIATRDDPGGPSILQGRLDIEANDWAIYESLATSASESQTTVILGPRSSDDLRPDPQD